MIVVLFISLCPRIRDKHSSECSSSRISWATTSDVESEGGGKCPHPINCNPEKAAASVEDVAAALRRPNDLVC